MIKVLRKEEIDLALRLCINVFDQCLAPTYSQEGIDSFHQYAELSNIMEKWNKKEIFFWGSFNGTELQGTIAVTNSGHISLFFVKQELQRKGIGSDLWQTTEAFCTQNLGIVRINVNASLIAVEAYKHLGFLPTAPTQLVNGLSYIPMEYIKSPVMIKPKKMPTSMVIFLAVSCVIVLILVGIAVFTTSKTIYKIAKKTIKTSSNSNVSEYEEKSNKKYNSSKSQVEKEKLSTDIQNLDSHISSNLAYEIFEVSDVKFEDEEVPLDFKITYPELKGLSSTRETAVNELIRNCAFQTKTLIYKSDLITKEDMDFFSSDVNYKVAYASDELISIIFEDYYFIGNYGGEFKDLRTLTINLKTGKQYEISEILNIDEAFMVEWRKRAIEESPDNWILEDLDNTTFTSLFLGETSNRYFPVFFVKKGGIEIGFTYHHNMNSRLSRGWLTIPFSLEEINMYKTNSEFWNVVKSDK